MKRGGCPIFLRHARVLTRLRGGRVIEDAGIIIRDGKIAFCGPLGEVEQAAGSNGDDARSGVVDLRGTTIIPALTNAHTHLYSSLARGMPGPSMPPEDFAQILERVWWPLDAALDEEDIYISAIVGLMECARAGVASVIDHHASQRCVEGSLDAVARAARELGLRVATCFEVSDRAGADSAAGIAENVRFARAIPAGERDRLAAFMGLHASLTLDDATLDHAVGQATDAELGCHIHVAEDEVDNRDALRRGTARVVRRLADHGVLTGKGIAAHCVNVDEEEAQLLGEVGVRVVVNPESNMNNAVGAPRLGKLREKGVRLAVGTDGLGSDVLRSAFSAALLERHAERDPRTGFAEAALLLEGSDELAAETFGTAGAGSLAPGAPADLTVLDYDPPTPLDGSNAMGHMLFGALGSRVRDLIVGGRWVLRDRRFTGLDEASVGARARERARSLWGRLD